MTFETCQSSTERRGKRGRLFRDPLYLEFLDRTQPHRQICPPSPPPTSPPPCTGADKKIYSTGEKLVRHTYDEFRDLRRRGLRRVVECPERNFERLISYAKHFKIAVYDEQRIPAYINELCVREKEENTN